MEWGWQETGQGKMINRRLGTFKLWKINTFMLDKKCSQVNIEVISVGITKQNTLGQERKGCDKFLANSTTAHF